MSYKNLSDYVNLHLIKQSSGILNINTFTSSDLLVWGLMLKMCCYNNILYNKTHSGNYVSCQTISTVHTEYTSNTRHISPVEVPIIIRANRDPTSGLKIVEENWHVLITGVLQPNVGTPHLGKILPKYKQHKLQSTCICFRGLWVAHFRTAREDR